MDQILINLSLLSEFPIVNLKIVLDGIMVGALFALAAYGLALVWGVMNVKNLAQGDFVIAGGYVAWWLAQKGVPPLLGVPVAFVVLWVIGWVVYKLVISRVIERGVWPWRIGRHSRYTLRTIRSMDAPQRKKSSC